jgi:hypothetical protein
MSEYDSAPPRLAEPNDAEIDRMLVVLGVTSFIRGNDPARKRRCVMALASGATTSKVAAMWRPGSRIHRQAIYDLRVKACSEIVQGFMSQWGIRWDGKQFGVN